MDKFGSDGAALGVAIIGSTIIAITVDALTFVGLRKLMSTSYGTYFAGAQFVHFMLGPATMALAIPLYANLNHIKKAALPMIAALVAGSLAAMFSAVGIAAALGLDTDILLAFIPKSATPVALSVSEAIGGSPSLTAVFVITTGITGAIIATPLLNLLRITDWRARGFAVGVASHGIGTARAFQANETAGAFPGIGMGLNALLTALIARWLRGGRDKDDH